MNTQGIRPILRPAPVLPNRKNARQQEEEQKRLEAEKRNRADEMARRALRLKPKEPAPAPELSPELQHALESLGNDDRIMTETVMGCTQELTRRIGLAQKKAEDQAGAGQEANQRMSFAQLLVIRRSNDGTLTGYDVERARISIDANGAQAWVNPISSGADDLFQQAQEMLAANRCLVDHIGKLKGPGRTPALDYITQQVNFQASTLSHVSTHYQAQFHMDDTERLQQIAQGGLELRKAGVVNGVGRP